MCIICTFGVLWMQQWSVVEGVCGTPGAEGIPTYGVQALLPDGTCWVWEDVDLDRRLVERLANRLQRIQPSVCHFSELVTDYIEEIAVKV